MECIVFPVFLFHASIHQDKILVSSMNQQMGDLVAVPLLRNLNCRKNKKFKLAASSLPTLTGIDTMTVLIRISS